MERVAKRMPYQIKQKGAKFFVVDTTTQKIKGSYDDEDSADDRKDDLEFKEHVRDRLSRMPVSQMSADEKAQEYDRLMAEKTNAPPPNDPNVPPKIDTKIDPPKVKHSAYWEDVEE
jgi:hypothetical protein